MLSKLLALASVATALTLGLSGWGRLLGLAPRGDGPIASQMIFGGPPEFKTRADGIPGLKKNYGVEFGKYTVTDVGGPVTVNALKRGQVDAADLFTTDPAIKANDFVVLEDPKSNFAAQNIVPDHREGQGHRRCEDGAQRHLGQADQRGSQRPHRQGGQRQGGPRRRRQGLARRERPGRHRHLGQGRHLDGRVGELPGERHPRRDLRRRAGGPGRHGREEAQHRQPREVLPGAGGGLPRPLPRVHRRAPRPHRRDRHGDDARTTSTPRSPRRFRRTWSRSTTPRPRTRTPSWSPRRRPRSST